MNTSVSALHVALAAAFVGWIVFSICHSVTVWRKRNAVDSGVRTTRWLITIALVCCAAVGGGWLNRELQRRAGIIAGTDLFVVRARTGAVPHLTDAASVRAGETLATYDSSEKFREEERLRGELAVLRARTNVKHFQPLVINPELVRKSQELGELQRARLTELGFGTLEGDKPAAADPTRAERAKADAAKRDLERTKELVEDGILPRQKLESAIASADEASQSLREREQLISISKSGAALQEAFDAQIRRDGHRAEAERSAELSELDAEVDERHQDLARMIEDDAIKVPFAGNVVYRNPSPALAINGQAILAVAKGAGFVATVQVPARDVAMLVPGQALVMKLEHSLVSEEVTGELASIKPALGSLHRATLSINCNLPAEQFAAFSSESVPVVLEWRPPLYTDPVAQLGFAIAAVLSVTWFVVWLRAAVSQAPVATLRQKSDGIHVAEREGMQLHPAFIGEPRPHRVREHVEERELVVHGAAERPGTRSR